MKTPPIVKVATPAAASYLWRISDSRLRRLALDGNLPFRIVTGWGRKPSRAYSYDACVERWGAPDPDRLSLLLKIELVQITGDGAATWELLVTRPVVLDQAGDLATTME